MMCYGVSTLDYVGYSIDVISLLVVGVADGRVSSSNSWCDTRAVM